MALVVGTNTYADEAHAAEYIALMGLDDLSDPEASLKRATRSLDDIYGLRFAGEPTDSEQPLAWPRDGSTSIPHHIADATVELALMIEQGLNVFAQEDPLITSSTVAVGPITEAINYAIPFKQDHLYRISMLVRGHLVSTSTVRLVRG